MIRPRPARDGFNLESEVLTVDGIWYTEVSHAISYAKHRAGSEPATIQVFDASGALVEIIEHDPTSGDHRHPLSGM